MLHRLEYCSIGVDILVVTYRRPTHASPTYPRERAGLVGRSRGPVRSLLTAILVIACLAPGAVPAAAGELPGRVNLGLDRAVAGGGEAQWDELQAALRRTGAALGPSSNPIPSPGNIDNPSPMASDFCGDERGLATGDVNGDGRDDIVMGCTGDDTGASTAGNMLVFIRNPANTSFDVVELANPDPEPVDNCGVSVAVGDVNGDGRDDPIMGCHGDSQGGAFAEGSLVVFTRNPGNTGFDAGVILAKPTPVADDQCGWSAAAGDVNGDGRDDLVMGCPMEDTGADRSGALVVFTRNVGNNGFDPGVILTDPTPTVLDNCGAGAAVGDVNGDGREDPVMGCPYNDTGQPNAGNLVVFTRNVGNNGFDAGVELVNPTPINGDFCGVSLAIGDVNNDGRDDPITGCQYNDAPNSLTGNMVVFLRNVGNTGFNAGVDLNNPTAVDDDICGTSVGVGDVNGDGRDDPIMGCPFDDTGASNAGNMIVFPRNAANTGFDPAVELADPTPVASNYCGSSVAAGDVNGDGRDDPLMGCPNDDTGATSSGNLVLHVRNATNTGFVLTPPPYTKLVDAAATANDDCGTAVASGDVNNDGLGDLVTGCPGDDTGAGGAGNVFVKERSAGNGGFDAGVAIADPTPTGGGACGTAVALGDVNRDGREDLLVGCPGENAGAAGSGNVIVFTRNAANNGFDAGVELAPPSPVVGGLCGQDVAVADINDDGMDDLVVGCPGDDTGAAQAGAAVVYFRNAANTGFDPGFVLVNNQPATDDQCGLAVAAGDLDADGRADVVMGCPFDDPGAVADAGDTITYERNAANTGFDGAYANTAQTITAGDQCGGSIDIGNIPGDGRGTMVMGCVGDDSGAGSAGSVHVFTRNAFGGFNTGVELVNPTPTANDECGTGVGVGDVNGDGYSDVTFSCKYDDTGASAAGGMVVYARNDWNDGFHVAVEYGNPTATADDECGDDVALGDVDADGRTDVAFGCHGDDTAASGAGSVVLYSASASHLAFTSDIFASAGQEVANPTPVSGDLCAYTVAMGDTNGDGHDDLLYGCYRDNTGAGDAGNVIVFVRNAANTAFLSGVELANPNPAASDYCGYAVAFGDTNGDGYDDVLMGCYFDDQDGADTGDAYVFLRNATNDGYEAAVRLPNPTPVVGDICGQGVAFGDFNADGRDDVAMGCTSDDSGASAAGNVVVYIRNVANNGYLAAVELADPTPTADDNCGLGLDAGDTNGDGKDDIIVGCPDSTSGAILIFTRNAGNNGFDAGVEIPSPLGGTTSRCALTVAFGDVNGDGRDDAILGCSFDDTAASDAGSMYVYNRNAANNGYNAGVRLQKPTPAASQWCGVDVAAGDVNGDGREDAVMGCYGVGVPVASATGHSVVFLRNPGNTNFLAGRMLEDPEPDINDSCGIGVATGDVDGDGKADVLTGCFGNGGFSLGGDGYVNFSSGLQTITTRDLYDGATSVTSATINAQIIANGWPAPVFELSPDGGSTWTVVPNGGGGSLGASGTDVRLRVTFPGGFASSRSPIIHDLVIDFSLSPPTQARDGAGPGDIDFVSSASTLEANWDPVTHPDLDEYEYCFSTSSTGADCAAGATVAWSLTPATSVTRNGLGLVQGTEYFACVRSVNIDASRTAATCSDGQVVDSVAPSIALAAPANVSLTGTQQLSATYTDPAVGTTGTIEFQVCSDAGCGSVVESNSSSSGIASGSDGFWSHSQVPGGYWWRARSTDQAGNQSAWSAIWSFTYVIPPTATLISPANGVYVASVAPTLTARHDDPAADTGTLTFEVCTTNAASPWSANCGAGYQSFGSVPGILDAGNGSASPNIDLIDGQQYFWRARSTNTLVSGNWSAPWSFTVDVSPPAEPSGIFTSASTTTTITVDWDASTDAGSGTANYDVEYSADGAAWSALCTNTATRSCQKTGLAAGVKAYFRIRATDTLGTNSDWSYYTSNAAVVPVTYKLRTSLNSVVLTSANNRRSTTTSAVDNVTTSVQHDATVGWFIIRPNVLDSIVTSTDGGEPLSVPASGTPYAATGAGWVIDDVAGKTMLAGSMPISIRYDSTRDHVGFLQCRIYKVQRDGAGNILASSLLFKTTTGDVLDGNNNVDVGCGGTIAATVNFAADEALYAELWLNRTGGGGGGTRKFYVHAEAALSYLTPPPFGVLPSTPVLQSPADLATTTTITPTLTAAYSHPIATAGSVTFQVATDTGFASVVETGISTTIASGANGSFVAQSLTPGATYYWRAMAVDANGFASTWSSYRTLTANNPPTTPTNTSPANASTTALLAPTLTASAFADPDGGDTHANTRWQVRKATQSYYDVVADSGITATDLTSWTTPALSDNTTYAWRVRYQDSAGNWTPWSTQTTFTVDTSSGGSVTLTLDQPTVNLGTIILDFDATATSTATVETTNPTGYTLTATDESDTWGIDCPCADDVIDWTGTDAVPTVWTGGTSGYFGITVRDTTGTLDNRLAKWGNANAAGWPAADYVNNKYTGLENTSSTTLHQNAAATGGGGDTVTLTYRINADTGTTAGNYDATVTYTATANA